MTAAADEELVQVEQLDKVGFFPPDDRMKLAMRLNGLLASPSFASWAAGPPLDIESMLFDPDGRPLWARGRRTCCSFRGSSTGCSRSDDPAAATAAPKAEMAEAPSNWR